MERFVTSFKILYLCQTTKIQRPHSLNCDTFYYKTTPLQTVYIIHCDITSFFVSCTVIIDQNHLFSQLYYMQTDSLLRWSCHWVDFRPSLDSGSYGNNCSFVAATMRLLFDIYKFKELFNAHGT